MKKKSKAKKWIIIGIVIIVLIVLYIIIRANSQKIMSDYAESAILESTATIGKIDETETDSGVIAANKQNDVFAPMGGTVTKQYLNIGDSVNKDQTIFDIGGYPVKSPIKGQIIWTNANVNDYIGAAASSGSVSPVAVVADMSSVKFTISVDELYINKVKVGMSADVTADAIPNTTFAGTVTKVNNAGVSTNGVTTYDVEITISDYGALKIGMNVNATLTLDSKEDSLIIPMSAINKSGAETYVYVKDQSYTGNTKLLAVPTSLSDIAGYKKQDVTVGLNNKDNIEILSGLKEGDKVYSISSSQTLTQFMQSRAGGGSSGFSIGQ